MEGGTCETAMKLDCESAPNIDPTPGVCPEGGQIER
jgi:hypothetical protein